MYKLEIYGKNRNKYINFEEVYMETSKLKNMIVLKNLPSNLVEEAIVILKSNQNVKKLEKIERKRNGGKEKLPVEQQEYIVKEAEMLVNQYVSKLEKKKEKEIFNKEIKKKYKMLKKYACLVTGICFIQIILLLVK